MKSSSSQWQIRIYTVSELTAQIKKSINSQFQDVLVEGEVSNMKLYPSGHLYFTLKDDFAMINAVVFNYYGRYPEDVMKDGIAVICKGRVDVYERRGQYQLLVDEIEVKGLGLLQLKFQMLKEKLFKEGIFDVSRKKTIPLLPERIGIITSPVGAAIRDMLKIIFGKFENMSVTICPVKVQGDEACYEIVEAITHFNKTKDVDVIIIGRGGGSFEDLAPFNEEIVARAIYDSEVPIVSGIGHEIDFTIADFVADVRAPTPTAAADLVVKGKKELLDIIVNMKNALEQNMKGRLEKARFSLYQGAMELKERKDFIVTYRMYLDEILNNLIHGFTLYFRDKKGQIETLTQRIKDLSPDNILKRGYSITVKRDTKEVVVSTGQVVKGEDLLVKLHKGELGVSVQEKHS
jgi:exodeoxyribonuclease VII large subunit